MLPIIVNRKDHPKRYWGGIALKLVFFVVAALMAFSAFTTPN